MFYNLSYPNYQRTDSNYTIKKENIDLSNQWIVPYNPYLVKKFKAHTNVEICTSVTSVKYLYKYVYKGIYNNYLTKRNLC